MKKAIQILNLAGYVLLMTFFSLLSVSVVLSLAFNVDTKPFAWALVGNAVVLGVLYAIWKGLKRKESKQSQSGNSPTRWLDGRYFL